jgi:hypothetical protein
MIFKDFRPCPLLEEFVEIYHLRHFVFSNDKKLPSNRIRQDQNNA